MHIISMDLVPFTFIFTYKNILLIKKTSQRTNARRETYVSRTVLNNFLSYYLNVIEHAILVDSPDMFLEFF